MIYIVGHTFQFNTRPIQSTNSVSIQSQIAVAKNNQKTYKSSSAFDSRFIPGNTYRIARIQPIKKDNVSKVHYIFANMTNPSIADIDIDIDNTSAGDDYIAAISGKRQQLEDTRNFINAANELNHDI